MKKDFESLWLAEERAACMDGWDFSYLEGRCREDGPPWDYRAEIQKYLTPEKTLLDIETGGCDRIPTKLEALKEEDLDFLAQSAAVDACTPGNPKDVTIEELKDLFRKLM